MKDSKRVTLFCGHYGSGKTNIAVNYALYLRKSGKEVAIGDLDVVNPYFRTADSRETLEKAGVRVIALPFANTSVDLPSLPSEAYSLVEDRSRFAVIDVGGDDRGAYALGRYVPYILEENDYEMVYVANFMRPLTRTAPEHLEVMREIEDACGIPFTGIVHNSNLGAQTVPETVASCAESVKELAKLSGIPILFTAVDARLEKALEKALLKGSAPKENSEILPLMLQRRPFE